MSDPKTKIIFLISFEKLPDNCRTVLPRSRDKECLLSSNRAKIEIKILDFECGFDQNENMGPVSCTDGPQVPHFKLIYFLTSNMLLLVRRTDTFCTHKYNSSAFLTLSTQLIMTLLRPL